MKSTTIVLGFLAALTSASYNHPRHFHSPRPVYRRNTTESVSAAAGHQVTLTVDVTSTHTYISCAATVTNCPARNNTSALAVLPASQLTTVTVTDVIDLTTTVCPLTAAGSVSSAVVASYTKGLLPGKTRTASITAYPTNTGVAAASSVTTSVGTKDTTVTMTVGGKSSQSVVVTTLHSTYTDLVTVTETRSSGKTVTSDSPVGISSGTGESTSTTTSTSTGTRTVTIARASTATATTYPTGSAGDSTTGNSATGGDSAESSGVCPAAVTVTVTAAAVTVTVPASTVYQTVTAPSSGVVAAVTTKSSGVAAVTTATSTASASASASGDSGEEDECPTETDSGVVTATKVVSVVPYPTGPANGTFPKPTGGAAGPTGAFRLKY